MALASGFMTSGSLVECIMQRNEKMALEWDDDNVDEDNDDRIWDVHMNELHPNFI